MERTYVAIDLKSFFASVECVERGLDALDTCLVVADSTRTEKTICLAVTPALKSFKISGRARLFEVVERVREVNAERLAVAKLKEFKERSHFLSELNSSPELELDYIIAPPQMAKYMQYSTQIYGIYLKYVAPEDIHVYSVDEVFIDATNYLKIYNTTAHDFAVKLIRDVLKQTGITATAGIGENLYLCKVALDIMAKRVSADKDGVRIAELSCEDYKRQLWDHRPLTDFWRVGRGYSEKLEAQGIYTMGDIARCSLGKKGELYNEDLLYKLFGVNAELLIDHAWGVEPCTIADIKAYKPQYTSLSTGQVLQCAYDNEKTRIVVCEMAENLSLDLVSKGLVTDKLTLTIGYDVDNVGYKGDFKIDLYGRRIPKHAHGTENLERLCSSSRMFIKAAGELFDRITDKNLLVRRINISAERLRPECEAYIAVEAEQLDLFTDYAKEGQDKEEQVVELKKENRRQKAVLGIREKYGKNSILKGMNLKEGATAKSRNEQIGGHKA